ncbi:MAG TPA: hypothetical protein VF902_08260 [Coriobacteriia bacterium]
MSEALSKLLALGPIAIAVGVHEFAESLRAQGATVEEVLWRPQQAKDARTERLLDALL